MIIYTPLSFTPLSTRVSLITLDLVLLLSFCGLLLITHTGRPTFPTTLTTRLSRTLMAALSLEAISSITSLIHAILLLPFSVSRAAMFVPTVLTSTFDSAASVLLTGTLLWTLHCHLPARLHRTTKPAHLAAIVPAALLVPVNLGLAAHWLRWRLSESHMAAAPRRHWGAGLLAAESFNLALFTYLLGCAGVLYALQRRAAAPPAERSKTPLRVAIAALALIVREVNALLTVGLVLVKRGGGGGGGGGGRAQGGALMLQTAVAGGMTVLAFAMVALVARGNERCMGGKDQDGYRGAMEEAVREVHRVAEGAGVEKLPVLPQAAAMGRV